MTTDDDDAEKPKPPWPLVAILSLPVKGQLLRVKGAKPKKIAPWRSRIPMELEITIGPPIMHGDDDT